MNRTIRSLLAPCAGTALALAALAARHLVHPGFEWLVYNIALAWVPLVLGVVCVRHPTLLVSVGPLWLLFLPNAPYLLTDLVHLKPRAAVPLWYDAVLLGGIGALGLAMGVRSLRMVAEAVGDWLGAPFRRSTLVIVPVLCGFGMALGRLLRFNSWDIVARPDSLLDDVLRVVLEPRANLDLWALSATLGAVFLAAAAFERRPVHVVAVSRALRPTGG